jgi:hypothetical protein
MVGLPQAATAAAPGPIIFNRPGAFTIEDKVVDLIHNTPAGSSIKMTVFDFETHKTDARKGTSPIADELKAADTRGVTVTILADPSKSRAVLNTLENPTAGTGAFKARGVSHVIYCGNGGDRKGCNGAYTQHNKFIIFGWTSGMDNVILQTSENSLQGGGGTNSANDAVVLGPLSSSSALWVGFNNYFDEMVATTRGSKTGDADFWHTLKSDGTVTTNHSGSGIVNGAQGDAQFMPRKTGNPWVDVINSVACPGSAIRVANAQVLDKDVVNALNSAAAKGCNVYVITNQDQTIPSLFGGGINVRADIRAGTWIHSKWMAIYTWTGTDSYRVYTGSANMKWGTIHGSDETFLRLQNLGTGYDTETKIYNAYKAEWDWLWSNAKYRKAGTSGGANRVAVDDVLQDGGDDTLYQFVNPNSDKCLDVAWGGVADGTNVQIASCNGSAAQDWKLTYDDSNPFDAYYTIMNPNSGKCLDLASGSQDDGANVQIYTCNGSAAQKWYLQSIPDADGDGDPALSSYQFAVKASGQCMDVAWAGTTDGTNVQQHYCPATPGTSPAQIWNAVTR